MSKLVDRERLAQLAAGLDSRMKAAVKAEEDRAKLAEKGLQDKIDAIENGESGILAVAKKYADDQDAAQKAILDAEDQRLDQAIKDEASRADGVEKAQAQRIEALESFKNAHSHTAMEQDIANLKAKDEELVQDIADEAAAREGADKALDNRVKVLEAFKEAHNDEERDNKIAALEAKDIVHETRMEAIEDDADALELRVKANEDDLAVVKGEGVGSIKKAQADAQAYADQQIAALVDSAPEAMNTLNELAVAIKNNKDVYDGYVAEHATAMANMKQELQAEIDSDVKVVADELAKQKDDAQEGTLANKIKANADAVKAEEQARTNAMNTEAARVNKKIADDIAAEAAIARAAEQANATAIENEANRAKGVEAGLDNRIKANEAFVAAQPAKDEAQDNRIQALEDLFKGDNSVDNKIAKVAQDLADHEAEALTKNNAQDGKITAVENRATDLEGRATAVEGRATALEGRMDDAEDEIDALQAFVEGHSHVKMESDIKANADAIVQEVADRNAAIADALKAYSTTEQMKAVIGNVVNSLALTMENDEVVLKLGGVDGIALASVSLDLASDDDIDAIINGLDA